MRVKNKNFGRGRKLKASALLLLAMVALTLAACGDAGTSTPVSQATTAAAVASGANPPANSSANPGTGNAGNNPNPGQNPNNGAGSPGANGAGRGIFGPGISGTIESYDASAKTLTVKDATGTSTKFDVTNARVTKTATITLADLGKLVTGNGIVQVVGDKGSDGSYNATRLIVQDPAMGAGFGGNGAPGQGQGRGQGQGQPGAGQAQPGQGQIPPNLTPGAGAQGRPGGGLGANAGIILRGGTLSGKQLSGTGFNGEAITVNLSDSTVLVERSAGSLTDLTTGQKVTVNARPAQGNAITEAALITID